MLAIQVSLVTDWNVLTMTNVPMVTITAMLTPLVAITMVVSHVHIMLVTLVKVTMMIAR